MEFKELLEKKEFIFLDGAMGTMLQKEGLDISEVPELLSITNPDSLIKIHKGYVDAGADILYANTFGVYSYKLEGSAYTLQQVVSAAIANARAACAGTETLVALDIGPTGKMLEPSGELSFEQAYAYFKEKVLAGKDADVIVIETMTDLYEMKAALLAAKEHSCKPVLCTMSFEQNLRTYTGCSISAMALTLESLGADAIGVNCSLGPAELAPIAEELSKWTTLPIILKPNAGLPTGENTYDITPQQFSQYIKDLTKFGVKILGGCCGTTPEYIRETVQALQDSSHTPAKATVQQAVCTATKTVAVEDGMIGESTVCSADIDAIIDDGFEQAADIITVNLNAFDKESVKGAVKELQSVLTSPLQLLADDPQVLEAAIRVYNGKPLTGCLKLDNHH